MLCIPHFTAQGCGQSFRLLISIMFVALFSGSFALPAHAQQGIIFDGATTNAYVNLPNTAPYNSLGGFQIIWRMRDVNNDGRQWEFSDGNSTINVDQFYNNRLNFYESLANTVMAPTPSLTDATCKLQFDPANNRWTFESWRNDGSGYDSKTTTSAPSANLNLGGRKLTIASNFNSGYRGAIKFDYWRWIQRVEPLGVYPGHSVPAGVTLLLNYEFDGSVADSSGRGLNLTVAGSAGYSATPLVAPSVLQAGTTTAGRVDLYFKDNSPHETGFKIERKIDVGGTYVPVATVPANATTYADTSTTENTVYYYRVRATNTNGDSAYSNETMVKTPAANRTLQTVKVFRQQTRIDVGKEKTFVVEAYDQNNVRFKYIVAQWSLSDSSKAELRPELDNSIPTYEPIMTVRGRAAGTTNISARVAGISSAPRTITVVDPAAAPVARIGGDVVSGALTTRVGEAVKVDAAASSGVKRINWKWGDGDETNRLLAAAHTYLVAGTYPLTLTVENSAGQRATTTATVTVRDHPAPTTTCRATTVQGILGCYNSLPLSGGGQIVIPAGSVLTGSLTLPERNFSDYITIRSDAVMPDIRTRINGEAGSEDATKLVTIRCSTNNCYPILVDRGAHHIRFIGIKADISASQTYGLFVINNYLPGDTTANQPHHLIFQHCVMNPPDSAEVTHGFVNNGRRVSVISSWFGNIRGYDANVGDAQAIFGSYGEGIHVYNNTFLEATGENFLYGGAATPIEHLVPSEIEFRRCYFDKRLEWRNDLSLAVKNLRETKTGRNIYVEGCVFQHEWDADQSMAIVPKSSNQYDDTPWAVSENIHFENCRISHISGGVNVLWDKYNQSNNPGGIGACLKPNDISFTNILFEDLNTDRWGSPGILIRPGEVDDLEFVHCTMPDPSYTTIEFNSRNNYNFVARDNIFGLGGHGIKDNGVGTIALIEGTANRWTLDRNVLSINDVRARTPDQYPNTAGNLNSYPASIDAVGYVDYAGGNYRLAAGSPYKNSASDGTDPGADIDLVEQSTANVMSGVLYTFPPAAPPATGILISEFRLRGANGATDEFVELYNNTDSPVTVSTVDGSNGWALAAANGTVKFVIPYGTIIPARAHYLAANSDYSLGGYASPDLGYRLTFPTTRASRCSTLRTRRTSPSPTGSMPPVSPRMRIPCTLKGRG